MLKRILLIVSLGVSFVAPAAFGATSQNVKAQAFGIDTPGLKGAPTVQFMKAGQDPEWRQAQLAVEGGSLCGLLTDVRAFQQENLDRGFTKNGARPGAGSARLQ